MFKIGKAKHYQAMDLHGKYIAFKKMYKSVVMVDSKTLKIPY